MDIVEEDEEAFMKSSSQVISFRPHLSQQPTTATYDTGSESVAFGSREGDVEMPVQSKEQRRNCCSSSEPFKMDLTVDLAEELQPELSTRFYPLDQQDWEDRIVWDISSAVSDNSMECYDVAPGSRVSSIKETEVGSGPPDFHVEFLTNSDEKDCQSFVHSSSVVGCFSEDSSDPQKISSSEPTFHPQLLRLESWPEVDQSNLVDSREKVAIKPCKSDALRRFDKLTLQNRNLMEGNWLDDIVWEPNSVMVKPKLILDLQDEQMLFELLDHDESELLQLRAGAVIVSHSPTAMVSLEMLGDGSKKGWQFNIANDKFYVNGNVSRQLQSSSSKRTTYGIKVHHSAAAIKLETMKLKLSNKDLANFHRPRAMWYPHNGVAVKEQWKLPTLGSMKIILKSLGGKGSKLHVDADETVSSVKVKASKKLDFKPSEVVKLYYLGKELEDSKSLAVQNVQPNSLLHLVRTKVHLMPRAQKIPRENKSLRPPGAFKKKSDLSVRDGHVHLMEYCEERPLLLSNAGMGANLCAYYQKSSPSDQTGVLLCSGTSLGNVTMLEPSDKSPFLGDIRPGCSQSALETNMYKAPIFPHKVPYTDYLLVRSAKGKLSIRRIDRIAVVGQQEPLMEVFSPGSKNLQAYMINRLLVYVYREFRAAEKRGVVPWIHADELSSLFPNLSEAILRKKLKECAVLRKDANGHLFWSKKRDFSIPSEDDLKKLVSPENVCSYESMQAGVYRLKHLGITKLTLPTGVSTAMSQLPDEAIALAAASHIERELQITPWSLSGNFVTCLNQDRENIERLEITGVGDPSGRGLGFSYVRAAPKAPISATAKKKAAAGRGGTTVTGTDADLRRLSMEAAREVLLKFNIPEEQIVKMTRWHRIAMIRKLSSEQAASGVKVDPTTISKYARGQRMSFLQLQQQTREKCQEIWDRQMQSLSAVDGDNESDTAENSDLDSFAGDLENLLDAEECEGNGGNNESKHEKSGGVRGLKMRRRPSQTQAEEEIEDEAAEAAELCRLLMDDDGTEQKKKKAKAPPKVPVKAPAVEVKLAPGSKFNFVDSTEQVKKSNKFQPNGSYTTIDNATGDLEEGESSFGKRKISDKAKTTKNKDSSSTTQIKARVKILGDGPQIFKEKKSSRESFVCGACHQPGHMRTNKNCPKYREDSETHIEAIDIEKAPATSNPVETPSLSQQKVQKKRSVIKSTTKIEPSESEKSTMKGKMIPVKIKCGSTENFSDKPPADGTALSSEAPSTSDVRLPETDTEAGSKSRAKVNKIIISNKGKAEDMQVESRRPSVVIRPPAEADRNQVESHKASVVIRPPANIDKDLAQSHKPSIVIRPPAEKDREQAHKKIVIKRTKEIIDLDQVSQDGSPDFEYRKTKKIVELSSFEKLGKKEATSFTGEWSKKRAREEKRWWEEEEKRRASDRFREDRGRIYEDKFAILEEQDRFAEVRRFEKGIWRDKDEERQKAKTKKKKKKKHVFTDDYLEDYRWGRNDKRMRESDRGAKRQPIVELGRFGAENAPVTKRRRGGEVGLANILEHIVDTLRNQGEVSWLFLQPVKKKEAPDYYNIIKRPMDLSTIRDKVRKMEYKNREEFRHDVCQITINAHIYNDGKNPSIPPLADQLLEICDFLLKEHEESLMEAEESIEP